MLSVILCIFLWLPTTTQAFPRFCENGNVGVLQTLIRSSPTLPASGTYVLDIGLLFYECNHNICAVPEQRCIWTTPSGASAFLFRTFPAKALF